MKVWSKTMLAAALAGGLALGVAGVVKAELKGTDGQAIKLTHPAVQPEQPLPPPERPMPAPRVDVPRLREAIRGLREVRGNVDLLEPRFRGHRAEALRAIDRAIGEIQACIDEVKDRP